MPTPTAMRMKGQYLSHASNKATVATVATGVQTQNLCAACHASTVGDWHQPCISCHDDPGHFGDITGLLPSTGSDCKACHGHGVSWAHPVADCHGSCHGWSPGTWRTF